MANSFFSSRGSGVLLFDEDFDVPAPTESEQEPEVIEPLYTLAELKAAREDAAREGREAALSDLDGSTTTAANKR